MGHPERLGGLKEGMVEIAPYGPAVPAEVAQEATRSRMRSSPRAASVHRADPQSGGRNGPGEGETWVDEEILHMDYYVQGIEGSLPT